MAIYDECVVRHSFKALKYSYGGDAVPRLVSEKNIGSALGGQFKYVGEGSQNRFCDLYPIEVSTTANNPVSLHSVQIGDTSTYTDGSNIGMSNPQDAFLALRLEFLDHLDYDASEIFINSDGGSLRTNASQILMPGESSVMRYFNISMRDIMVFTHGSGTAQLRCTAFCEGGSPVP